MSFRFVHTADIHLDSPLKSLALRNPELQKLVANATRQTLTAIVDLCLEEQVDALLIAGDLYDGNQTSMITARFLADQIKRLDSVGIRVFIIRGNHDAMSKITKELVMPETVKVFGGHAEHVLLNTPDMPFDIVVHGVSFSNRHAPESLLPKYKSPVLDACNIGMMHTSLDGAEGHDLYAPCSLADLQTSGFNYWALGHIHKRFVSESTECTVVMPGIPQGRDIGEAGAKSVTLVTVNTDRSIEIQECLTQIVQFEPLSVGLDGVESWEECISLAGDEIERFRETTSSENLVVRVFFTGESSLAWRLRSDSELLMEELASRAESIGQVWIEKVISQCTSPRTTLYDSSNSVANSDADQAKGVANPLDELNGIIERDIIAADSYLAEASSLVMELKKSLPSECKDLFGTTEDEFDRGILELAREGARDVMAVLQSRMTNTSDSVDPGVSGRPRSKT